MVCRALLTSPWYDARAAIIVHDDLFDLAKLVTHGIYLPLQQPQPLFAMLIVKKMNAVSVAWDDINGDFKGTNVIHVGVVRAAKVDMGLGLL